MKNTRDALNVELKDLQKAGDVLSYSLHKCSIIGVRADLSNEELEAFEALTARFSRFSDIVIQG